MIVVNIAGDSITFGVLFGNGTESVVPSHYTVQCFDCGGASTPPPSLELGQSSCRLLGATLIHSHQPELSDHRSSHTELTLHYPDTSRQCVRIGHCVRMGLEDFVLLLVECPATYPNSHLRLLETWPSVRCQRLRYRLRKGLYCVLSTAQSRGWRLESPMRDCAHAR